MASGSKSSDQPLWRPTDSNNSMDQFRRWVEKEANVSLREPPCSVLNAQKGLIPLPQQLPTPRCIAFLSIDSPTSGNWSGSTPTSSPLPLTTLCWTSPYPWTKFPGGLKAQN